MRAPLPFRIERPTTGETVFDALAIRAHAPGATRGEAQVAGRVIRLDVDADGMASGSVPLDGLDRGEHVLTVSVTDAAGDLRATTVAVDVQPFVGSAEHFARWPERVAAGEPVVHCESVVAVDPRAGWTSTLAVTGFAYCTQGLARLSLIVDGRPAAEPFHGLYRPDLETPLGNRAAVAAGFRGELLDVQGRELVVLAVAPDGRAAGWRGALDAVTAPPAAAAVTAPGPAPARRPEGATLAGDPPPGPDGWERLAERWAERALRAEAEHEAAQTDLAWSGLQTRLAVERAADAELARRAAARLGDAS